MENGMSGKQNYQGAGSVAVKCVTHAEKPTRGRTVGIGLIGCGGMGRSVARKVVEQSPRLRIRGLYDPDKRSIKASLQSFGSEVPVYADYRELCAAEDIDWVMIASWNCFHKEQTLAAFEAGKHVFCQKPLAITPQDCVAMHRAWRSSGRMFNIGFSLRYTAHYRAIHKLIAEGVIGDLVSMELNEVLGFNHGGYIMGDWRRLTQYAGTHLLEKCCHDIDLANWMVGARARRVASFGGLNFFRPENQHHMRRLGTNSEGEKAYRTWGGLVDKNPFTADKDIVDNQVAIIEYENGVRATFHTNCNSGIPERRMYINGSEGTLRADFVAGSIHVARIGFNEKVRKVKVSTRGSHGGGDAVLARELCRSMLTGRAPEVGLDEGLTSAFTCFGIDEAMHKGAVVEMDKYWKLLR
jgi:predicted dehydrogenase